MVLREALMQKLQSNTNLTGDNGLLALNVASWERDGSKSRSNSIIHVNRLTQNLVNDFITIDYGEAPQVHQDRNVAFYGEILYIRAYIAKGSGYVRAVKLLQEVYKSLNNAVLQADDETPVRVELINTGADLFDEGVGMEFKQATYRLLKLI